MRLSLVGLLSVSAFMVAPLAYATDADMISDANKSVISSTVLCQNLPAVKKPVDAQVAYAKFIDDTAELFGNNAKKIKSNTVGINKDHQMTYILKSPINIVGMSFETVNITHLKEKNYNYYQVVAEKPFLQTDRALLENVPENDNLTVSTKEGTLKLICNVRAAEVIAK